MGRKKRICMDPMFSYDYVKIGGMYLRNRIYLQCMHLKWNTKRMMDPKSHLGLERCLALRVRSLSVQ